MKNKLIILSAVSLLALSACANNQQGQTTNTNSSYNDSIVKNNQDKVYFGYNQAMYNKDAIKALEVQTKWLKENPDSKVVVEGHADSRGSNQYNEKLGVRRTESVKKYLVSHGVKADRVSTVSYGETKPVCTETMEECYSQNRRGVTVVGE